MIFQDGGRRHFGFSKIRNFNGRSAVGGQCASLYQMLSKSVELMRYSDLTFFFKQKTAYEIMPSLVGSEMCIRDSGDLTGFFKMAAVRHLGFAGRRLGPPATTS